MKIMQDFRDLLSTIRTNLRLLSNPSACRNAGKWGANAKHLQLAAIRRYLILRRGFTNIVTSIEKHPVGGRAGIVAAI